MVGVPYGTIERQSYPVSCVPRANEHVAVNGDGRGQGRESHHSCGMRRGHDGFITWVICKGNGLLLLGSQYVRVVGLLDIGVY